MNEKTLTTLEFDKVLARLAEHTSFSAGRELALTLRPSPDYAEVVRRQRLTAEARRLLAAHPSFSMGGARDIRPQARKAALGGILEPFELLDVQSTLSAARSVRTAVLRLERILPLLAVITQDIPDLSDLAADIGRCITPRGEVADAASPVLAQLRRDVKLAHDRLVARMNQILYSGPGRLAAQEPIITLRDSRYVIPVKADMRSQLPGIVHDVSGSGATLFVEPLAAVELGNQWREFQIEEQREVERVLRSLSAQVGYAADAIDAVVEGLAEIDLALAKARLGEALHAHDLPAADDRQAWLVPAPAELRLIDARHPLLKGNVVPISVQVGGDFAVLLITGPNTGGKTVALKTAGLLVLMAQAGLPVPAERGSQVPAYASVHADIGDEQSIEQSLSTFSSHMGNIIQILQEAGPCSLVLLDELGAGTDPAEGSALAQAVLRHLLRTGCATIATTHHGALKVFAHTTPGIANASVEFDPETLSPTYRLIIGLPGQSNALAIASRLGLSEEVLEDARRALSPQQVQMDELLAAIQREREQLASARQQAQRARRQAEELEARRRQRLAALEERQEQMLADTRRSLENQLVEAQRRLRAAERKLEKAKVSAPAALQSAAQEVTIVDERLAKLKRRRYRHHRVVGEASKPETIAPGDFLWIAGLGRPGEVVSPPNEEGEVEVLLGSLRTRVRLSQVERVEHRPAAKGGITIGLPPAPSPRPPAEIEVRGQTVDDTLIQVDHYLDEAFRAGLPSVRIVHGKGTGTLRRVVREVLSNHPLVKGFETPPPAQGGEGVTVVYLAL